MEWMPDLRLGLLNGWIPLALLALTDGILFLIFPKEVVARLFDRSGWSQRQVVFTVVGKLGAVGCVTLLILTPLKIGSAVFVIGMALVLLGLVGLARALFDFSNTPPGEPVTRGIYQFSRHPQIVMSSLVLLGGCIAIGSWSALLLLLAARLFGHFGIRAEEAACLERYGDAYQAYLERVPRYFAFL
ncbi:MAG: methyltransferase [Anaerolineae bacterium]|jgi:protein-S-isoprenylcysteine O-methyltransferase Ste14